MPPKPTKPHGRDRLLSTKSLMELLDYKNRETVTALFRGEWKVEGGTILLPSGDYRLRESFFWKWAAKREVALPGSEVAHG